MKNLLIAVGILCLLWQPCSSQNHLNGSIPLGGSVSAYYSRSEYGNKYFSSWINPKIGRYINDRDVLGFSVFHDFSWTEHSYDSLTFNDIHNLLSLNPFWRRDIPQTDRFGFYFQIQGGIGYGITRSEDPGGHDTEKAVELMARAMPGLYYFLTDRLCVDGTFGIFSINSKFLKKHGDSATRTTVSLALTGEIGLGLQYYFNK